MKTAPESPPAGIDAERVTTWYLAFVPDTAPPLSFALVPGGNSNLTYIVTDREGRKTVLRRPPLGAILATAHDMAREHKIISALAATRVPVPRPLGLCTDPEVTGAPFYVMEYVPGEVLESAERTRAYLEESARRKLGEEVVEVLAALHALVPEEVGLGDLGKKEAYIERQLRRWRTQWEKSKTRELPLMEEVHRELERRIPPQVGACVVHGDYRIGNMLVRPDGTIAAVLDWELCTLGDPLADLGYLLNDWTAPGETVLGSSRPAAAGGFPSREEILRLYAQKTGRDVSRIGYYRAFQSWRLAVIVEGVLARFEKGVMGRSTDTAALRAAVETLALEARQLLREVRDAPAAS
ncbi:MAG: acyl-CoA dehydrogenase [Candidatus Binatia bacterium]|nr:MAG: acyl-CoA dehydrogenase [Candidatus Binatia bacterium]